MKILLTPLGSRGDVYPIFYLAQALHKKGHIVTICTSPENRSLFEKEGLKFIAVGSDMKKILEVANPLLGHPLKSLKPFIEILQHELELCFTGIKDVAKDADLIIGSGPQFVISSLAELYKIPYRHILHVPIILKSKYHAPIGFPWHGLPQLVNKILWRIYIIILNMMINKTVNNIRSSVNLPIIKNVERHVIPEQIIIAVPRELGTFPPDNKNICRQLDYFFPQETMELSREVKTFLLKGLAPVYFGFGSMLDKKSDKTMATIQRVASEMKIRFVISAGWAKYRNSVNNDNIFFVGEESHLKLFPHMSAVIHHGGAGTTSTTAISGIPQIIIPHFLDQFYWAYRIKKLKIGTSIKKNSLTIKSLKNALNMVLGNDDIKINAQKIGELLKDRNGIDQFVDDFEALTNDVV